MKTRFVAVIDRALREPAEPDGEPMNGKIAVADVWTLVGVAPERRSPKQHELLNAAMEQLGWKKVDHLRIGEGRTKGRRPPHFVRGEQPYERIVVMMDGSYPSKPVANYESDTRGEGKAPIF